MLFFVFFKARKMWQERMGRKETKREKMREPKTKVQEYGTSYHLVELYTTVQSSEPLTVRPVTVFHSHEVFTLHCSTSVLHSITVTLVGSVNTVYSHIQ